MNRCATQNSTTALRPDDEQYERRRWTPCSPIRRLVFALLAPYIAIGRTLLYFDLQAEAEKAPAKRWRERLPRRTAPAEA